MAGRTDAAEWKPQPEGGRGLTARRLPHPRFILPWLVYRLILIFAYPLRLAVRRLTARRRRRREEMEALVAMRATHEEHFVGRIESLSGSGMTVAYLLQSCIDQVEVILRPNLSPPIQRSIVLEGAGRRILKQRRTAVVRPFAPRKTLPFALALTLVAPVILVFAASASIDFFDSYVEDFVPPQQLAINQPAIGAKVYDRNGRLLHEYIDEEEGVRIPVAIDAVADAFLAATIATEDASFYTNPGVNPRGIARAALENIGPLVNDRVDIGELTDGTDDEGVLEGSGGSSITQQLVKNVYIPWEERQERSLDRKLREAIFAVELTNRYDKHQILEWYVNQISYGGLFNGIEAASRGYFGKTAAELTLAEAALLAGIPQSPARYEPLSQPEATVARRNEILDLIERQGRVQVGDDRFFEPTKDDLDAARAEPLELHPKHFPLEAPHFVLDQVQPQIEAMFGKDALYREGLIVTTSIDLDLQERTRQVLERWIGEFEGISNSRNGAVVVLDAPTGEILAFLGSRDYFRDDLQGNVNNLQALNSPGSSFKPFVFLSTFEKLGWSPATLIDDSPVTFRESDGTVFQPLNPNKSSYLGNIPIRTALGNSLNVPAFKAALRLGVPTIIDMGKRVGITTLHGLYGPAISIGGVDLTPLDLTYAYSVLANNGSMVGQPATRPHADGERGLDPVAILRVEDVVGNVLFDINDVRDRREVVSPSNAYQVTSILSDPQAQCLTFGCGGISVPGKTVGVKTGTSEPFDPRGPNAGKIGETWAFGYTPDYVVGVWAGNSDNAPIVNIFSTSISFRVMRDTIQMVYGDRPATAFVRPDGLEERRVCTGSNCRNEPLNARQSEQVGAQPTPQPSPAPAPQQAQQPAPPASQPAGGPAQAGISSIGGSGGTVSIQGYASSPAMQYYSLEISGPGGAWQSVGQWSRPVQGGSLGALSGLAPGTYSVRVVVQDAQAGRVVSAPQTVQVR